MQWIALISALTIQCCGERQRIHIMCFLVTEHGGRKIILEVIYVTIHTEFWVCELGVIRTTNDLHSLFKARETIATSLMRSRQQTTICIACAIHSNTVNIIASCVFVPTVIDTQSELFDGGQLLLLHC